MKHPFETVEFKYWAEPSDTKAVKGMRKTADRRPDCRNHYWSLHCPTLDSLWHRRWARLADMRINRARAAKAVSP